MGTERVHLPNETETYLPTLYGKALDNRAAQPILGDRFADEAVQRIDFDFKKLKLAEGGAITLPIRAKILDTWVREFLAVNPSATVLHLGCGLDTRVFRIDPPPTVRWYDLDLPEVIELRKQLYPELPNLTLIAASVTDLQWLDQIPGDLPVMVVAEGLMMYLPEEQGVALLNRITQQFPSGEIIFDAYSRLTVRILNWAIRMSSLRTKATAAGAPVNLPWGIDDPHKLEQEVPRLRLVSAVSFLTLPELVARLSQSRVQEITYGLLERFEWYRRSMWHLRYAFPRQTPMSGRALVEAKSGVIPGERSMTTATFHFTKEKETMLMTLSGRAFQNRWKHPILPDPWADEALRHTDYDIRKHYGTIAWNLVADIGCTIIATRAATFDLFTKRYLNEHPNATVLHVGCGLDSRAFRVKPPASVRWFDVDYPDVIDFRRQLFPGHPGYYLIGAPLEDLSWLDETPQDRPVLLIAEGVTPYLTEAEVKALLTAVVERFPSGQIIFDAVHPWVVKRTGSNVGGTGATYKWGLDDPLDVEQLEPRLELVHEYKQSDQVAFARFPLWLQMLYRSLEVYTPFRRMERIVVYQFANVSPGV